MKKKMLIIYAISIAIFLILAYPISQAYISKYNKGNEHYRNAEYEEAIKDYKSALKGFIVKNKECMIRINYALALCKTVQVDEQSQDSIEDAIKTYESAIEILTQKNCVNHNDDAQILKEDIEREIERLKNLQESKEPEDTDEKQEEESEKNTKNIEDKIKQIKEEAIKEQRSMESQFKHFDYSFDSRGKNW